MYTRLFIALLLTGLLGCQKPEYQEQNMNEDLISENLLEEPANKEKPVIYQMMTRLFGNKKQTNTIYGTIDENGAGKFDDINDAALSALSKMGITHIWYTGIIEHAVLTDYREYGIFLDDADVVKGRAGSPYAIKDYYDVNPDLAVNVNKRLEEFDQLVKRTHDHKMKVIIDFVPNHVARKYQSDKKPTHVEDLGEKDDSSVSFDANNNFYYLPDKPFQVPEGYVPLGNNHEHITKDGKFEEVPAKVSGNNVFKPQPDINDWFETVKLNYGIDYNHNEAKHFDPIPSTWKKMKDILVYWTEKQVDGFRCDMAEMVPVEFWEWVIPQIKEINPDILFIAEIYNPAQYENYLFTGKFDFLYDKVQLYDTLKQVIRGKSKTSYISDVWKSLKGINYRMLRFLENHDEQRIASPYFAGDAYKALPAMTVSALLSGGPVMIYFGQEVGEKGEGIAGFGKEDGRTTIYDYWGVPAHQRWMNEGAFDGALLSEEESDLRSFYEQLLSICSAYPVMNSGNFFDLYDFNIKSDKETNEKAYYFLRFDNDDLLLIAVNFDERKKYSNEILLPHQMGEYNILPEYSNVLMENILNKEESISIKTGKTYSTFSLDLNPLQSTIYRLKK